MREGHQKAPEGRRQKARFASPPEGCHVYLREGGKGCRKAVEHHVSRSKEAVRRVRGTSGLRVSTEWTR